MEAVIYVFSGTGNTRKVAELYKKYLVSESAGSENVSEANRRVAGAENVCGACESAGAPENAGGFESVEIFSVEHLASSEKSVPDPNDYDAVGFAYPVHGFNAPKIFFDFCKSLPKVQDKKAFIFKTSGEGLSYNNYSSQKMMHVLEKKGFEFLSERHYVMPYNMIFRHSDEMVKSEWIYAKALAKLHSREIISDKKEKVHVNPLKAWFVPLFRIEWLYAQLQGPAMKVDMKKCIKCMKCVKACPYDNIHFDEKHNKFKFGTKCALCVRCSFGCPSCAISIGILNNWRINGSYNIEKTSRDDTVKFPYFTDELKGLHRWLYYSYYRKRDEMLKAGGVSLSDVMNED